MRAWCLPLKYHWSFLFHCTSGHSLSLRTTCICQAHDDIEAFAKTFWNTHRNICLSHLCTLLCFYDALSSRIEKHHVMLMAIWIYFANITSGVLLLYDLLSSQDIIFMGRTKPWKLRNPQSYILRRHQWYLYHKGTLCLKYATWLGILFWIVLCRNLLSLWKCYFKILM